MKSKFKALLTALAVVVLAAAVLVPIASASGMMGTPSPSPSSTMTPTPMATLSPGSTTVPGGWCGGGMWNGTGSWGGTGMWGTGSGMAWLTSNPDALAAWTQLRADHQLAMQTWYDTYKADLTTPQAQQALHDLWTKNWNDMKAFYEQYAGGATWTAPSDGMWGGWDMGGMMGHIDWDASHMWGSGYGASWMMSHSSGFGQWLTMRGRQTAAVSAWQHRFRAHPDSSAAQTVLQTMRTHQLAQVKSFYMHHGLSVTTARMRDGAGGWMGLGGMWGGFGW
jgi:hypothetical protein